MSQTNNNHLIERANELLEEITNHPSGYDTLLVKAVESGDLDEVRRVVTLVEGELSHEHFANHDMGVY